MNRLSRNPIFSCTTPAAAPRRRGMGMVMVMVALAVGTIIVLTFLSSQTTSMAIAHNSTRQTQARAIAEDGLAVVMEHVRATPEWRDDHAHGTWSADQPLNGGVFRVMFEDENDSDLSDDPAEALYLTVDGIFDGVTHRVQTRVTPTAAPTPLTVLLVTGSSTMSDEDLAKKLLFESWGYDVVTVVDTDSQSEYDLAAATADVAYISHEVVASDVGSKLNEAPLGVVSEETNIQDELRMNSGNSAYTGSTIDIVDNTHPIVAGFSLGDLQIAVADTSLIRAGGTGAVGLTTLAERVATDQRVLTLLDIGDTDLDGNPSPQRRVVLPWGGGSFEIDALNANGRQILRQAIEWAASGSMTLIPLPDPISLWKFEETTGSIATDSASGHNGIYRSGTTLAATGTSGYAVELDGSTGYVEVAHHDDYLVDEGTISVWFNLDDLSGRQELFSKDSSGNDTGGHITIYANGDDVELRFQDVSTSYSLDSGSRLSSGTWHHAAFTFGPAGMKLYLDGEEVDSDSYTGGMGTSSGGVGNYEPIGIGTNTWSSGNLILSSLKDYFDGKLDEVAFYGDQLTEQQILALFENQTAVVSADSSEPSLVALYEFIEPTPEVPTLVGHWKLDENVVTAGLQVLMVVRDAVSLTAQEAARQTMIESFGHTVILLSDESSQTDYDVSVAAADVIYVPQGVAVSQVDTKLLTSPKGIVTDEHDLGWEFRLSDLYSVYTGTQIDIVDATHYITSPFTTGSLSIASTTIYLPERNNQASGMAVLAKDVGGSNVMLGTVDFRDTLYDSSSAAGRRVILPWGYTGSDINQLSANGRTIFQRALEWVAANHVIDDTAANDGRHFGDPSLGAIGQGDGGTAIEFNGSDEYVEVPHTDAYLLNEGTLSFWFYANDLSGSQGMIAKDARNYGTGGHIRVYLSGSTLGCRIQTPSGSKYVTASSAVTANTWHHVAVGFGPGGLRLYLDGVERDTDSYTGGLGTSSGGAGNYEPWTFGVDQWHGSDLSSDGWDDPFHGRLDDIRLYDKNINEDQAADLASRNDPGAAEMATVQDTAGVGDPLNMTIADPDHVTWISGGGLSLDTVTLISTTERPLRLLDAVQETDQIAIVAEFTPGPIRAGNIGTIFSYNYENISDAYNFLLRDHYEKYFGGVRTNFASTGNPYTLSDYDLVSGQREHMIVSFADGEMVLYRNGQVDRTIEKNGDFQSWSQETGLTIGNNLSQDRPWLGTLHRIAIWDRGVNSVQAENLFNGNPPGPADGGEEGFDYEVEWLEKP
ncbi:MAG: LamG-like jellyroll fold domain-containing protein [Planctomycetota bacterium]